MLHIVTKSSLIEEAFKFTSAEDEIILLKDDEVYLISGRPNALNLINYDKFVELSLKHPKTLTWR